MTTKRKAERNPSFHHLCTETGQHEWTLTTAPGFETCNRSGCRAVRRWNGTAWVEQAQPVTAIVAPSEQPSLWSL